MKNPLSAKQMSRLHTAIEWSEKALEFPRRKRLEAIKHFVGYHYAPGGLESRNIVPILALIIQVYTRILSPTAPRALITTRRPELKPVAANFDIAVNQIPDEIGLAETLRKMVEEALFYMGIVKVGLAKTGSALGADYGKPFVDLVTGDDYFWDMSAKSYDAIAYEGNTYWGDYEDVLNASWLNPAEKDELKPDDFSTIGPAGENRAEGVSVNGTADQYRDRIWLRDTYLHKEGVLITSCVKSKKVLNVVKWEGPAGGPYIKLKYIDVPGNLMPLAPVALWIDLHEVQNKLFRKLSSQAESQKSVLGFQGGDDEGVNALKNAKDGDGIKYNGADPKVLGTTGVDAKTLAFYLQCKQLSSYFASNLDTLGGLAIQSETLGQDKMLGEAAGAQMRDMVDRTYKVVREIFYALSFYEWNDPLTNRTLDKVIPGTDLTIPVAWNQASKKGDINLYDLGVDIYSMQDNSPGTRLQKLSLIMQQFITPLEGQIQAAGGQVDVQEIFKQVARYADFAEVADLVRFVEKSDTPGQAQSPAGMPSSTRREYVRTGKPGMSVQGADATLAQQLLSQGGESGVSEGE
jgi:hypothetical protein